MNSIQNEKTTVSEAFLPLLKKEKPSLFDRLLLCFIFLAASVYLPLILFHPLPSEARDGFSILICALSILAQVRLSKKIGSGIGHAILLFLVGSLLGGAQTAAVVGATVSCACIFCWLSLTTASPLLIALPLLSYAGATVAIGSPFSGALALISMPLALLLLFSVRTLRPKVSAVCLISLGILVSAAVAAVLYLLLAHNGISMELIRETVDSLRELLTAEIAARLSLLGEELGDLLSTDAAHPEYARILANEVINHLPAILILLCNGIALITHSTMMRILLSVELPKERLAPLVVFDMSATSAVVFLASLFLSLAADGPELALMGAVCENLYLILIPGMILTLWMYLNVWLLAKAPSCFGLLLYLAIPLLVIQLPSVLLPLAAVIGAVLLLIGKIRRRTLQKKS